MHRTADQLEPTAGTAPARVEWRVPAQPTRVPEVRRHLREFAAGHGAPDDVLANVALAATEAVTNAVMHAYVDLEPGTVTVSAHVAPGELVVCVIDDGRGMQPRPDSPGLGMGLPMIGQLTTSVDIRERPAGGTDVRMRFAAPGIRGPVEPPRGDARLQLLVEVARLAQAGGWPQQGVGRLVHLLVPAIADACALDRVRGEELERLAAAGPEPPVAAGVPEGLEARVVAAGPGQDVAWWVEVPLRDADRPLGLLRLGLRSARGAPTPQDLVFVEALGERAARGLASAQLVADLHRTRNRVERILNSLAEAVTVNDEHGQIVYANAAAVRLLGAGSAREVLDSPPEELAARFTIAREDGSPVTVDDLPGRRVVAGLDAPPLLTRTVRRDTGRERWLLTKATLLDDDGDRLAVNVIEDVTEAKRGELRARFLARAGDVLTASLDAERTLRDVSGLIVPELADWCAIDLLDAGGRPRRVATAHADLERRAFAHELRRRCPPHERVGDAMRAAIEGGPPVLVPEITDEMLAAAARDEEELRLLRQVGMRSALVLPMRVGGRTVGVLTMIHGNSGRTFGEEDLRFGADIARRAAVAVENARLYAERR